VTSRSACLPRATLVEAALGVAQPTLPTLPRGQLAWQRIAARIVEALILLGVDGRGVFEDLPRDLLVAARGALRRIRVELRAVDGDHSDANQAGLAAERQHLTEQLGQRSLVALTEARDRRVIGPLVGADNARGNGLDAAPLDPPRRPLADRVAVEQQRDHHRRIVRRPALTVVAVERVERPQIERRDGVDDKPHEVPVGQPLTQARRQQQLLIAVAREEVLRHRSIVLTSADGPVTHASDYVVSRVSGSNNRDGNT
jgi:hypothetical protein